MHVHYKNLALIILIAAVTLPTILNIATYVAGNSYAPFGTVRALNPQDNNATITATTETTSSTSSEETTSSSVVVETTTSTTEAVTSTTEVVTSTTESLVTESTTVVTTTTTESSTQTTTEYSVVFEVNPSGAGSTLPSGGMTYSAGSTISITATAGSGYAFSGWSVSDASAIVLADSASPSTTATINGVGTITANFNPTTVSQADTQTAVSCSAGSVEVGGTVTCTATVTGGSSVSGQTVSWGSAGSGIFDSVECTLGDTGSCSVTYSPTDAGDGSHTLTANYAGDATHNPSSGSLTLTVTGSTTITTTTVTSLTSTGNAKIWTDKADYAPGDTPTIYGSGFLANAEVTVTVLRPEGTQNAWMVTADDSGSFTTSYATDGLVSGTFTVTATDGTNTAITTFTDKPSFNPDPCGTVTVGTSIGCKVDGVGSDYRPAHVNWYDASSTLQFSDACTSGSCTSTHTPGSAGTWTIKLVKDSDSSVGAQTTLTVNPPADTTPPVIAPTVAGTLGSNGWYISDVSVSWSVSDPESGIASSSGCGSTTINSDTTGTPLTCSATNGAGLSNSASVTIKRDATPPTVTLAADRVPDSGAWYNHAVTWTVSGVDGTSGVASCDSPITYSGPDSGSASVTGHCTDNAGNIGSNSASFMYDATGPSITGSHTPAANSFGWNNGPVTVSFTCSDSGSGLALGSPPADTVLSSEGSGQSVTGTCYDNAGNSASATVSDINIDLTDPTVTVTPNRSPDYNGWYNAPVGFTVSGNDPLSGIDTCTSIPDYSAPDGAGVSVSASCTDKAGNGGSGSFSFDYDATAPTVTLTPDRSPDHNGWYNHAVDFTVSGTDDTSDIASCDPDFTYSSPDDGSASVTGSCTDNAGNTGTGSFGFMYDDTAPSVTATPDRPADHNGWYNHALTVTFSATDDTSGVDTCDAPVGYSGPDTSATSVSGSCTDLAGNSASATFSFKYDATPPTVTLTPDRGTDHNGWYNHAVTWTVSGTDATSGGVTCDAPITYSGPDSATASVTGHCTDDAGNVGSSSATFQYDATAPSISITSPSNSGTYILNQPVASTYSCSDATSGMDTCTGIVPNGSNFATSPVGSKTFTVNAQDQAGNTISLTNSYSVQYSSSCGRSVLQPLEQVSDPSGLTKKYKSGSTLPVKFQLCDFYGNPVTTATATLAVYKVTSAVDTGDPMVVLDSGSSNDNGIYFRVADGKYIYNLSTKGLSVGTYRIVITLDDGTTITTYFQLSK